MGGGKLFCIDQKDNNIEEIHFEFKRNKKQGETRDSSICRMELKINFAY